MRVALALLLIVAGTSAAAAHAGPHGPAEAAPSVWDMATLAALAAAGALYAAGSVTMARRGARLRRVERVAFWAGWAVFVAAVAPALDDAAASAFSMHMVQHELLMLVGAPLVIVGRPVVVWLWALPAALRPAAGALLQQGAVRTLWQWLTIPVIAWALHGGTIWVWHLPALYEAAVESETIHALQHVTFVATAICFWWGLVYGRYGRAAYGASVLFVFTTAVHTGILGALFALSSQPFYAVYRDRAAAGGLDAVADQQLAGLYMWIPAGIILTLLGLALLLAWLAEAERRTSALTRRITLALLPAALAAMAGCGAIPHEADARALTGGDPAAGRAAIRQHGCDSCHTIPGVPAANATVGPPLGQVARRTYLAGRIANTPENMLRWIMNPQEIDPATAMPDTGLSAADARDVTAYLYTLR